MPRPRKSFSDKQKLQILENAIGATDIRDVLEKGIHRQNIVDIAHEAAQGGLITIDEYDAIAVKIRRPLTFPSDIELRLDSALAGPLNAESKQILTLLLRPNPLTTGQLSNQFDMATSQIWQTTNNYKKIEQYLLHSLDPIGFVSFSLIPQDSTASVIGHTITEAGQRYGQPLSAYALNLVNETGISLTQVLGSTSSAGDSRAPSNRFRILENLLMGSTRIADLSDMLNIAHSSVTGHLDSLKAMNLVEYDSASSEERGWAVYEWIAEKKPENVRPVENYPTLTAQVAAYLHEHKKGERHAITDFTLKGQENMNLNKEARARSVSMVLSGLAEQGFATYQYKGWTERSHVAITPDQEMQEVVAELTGKIRNVLQDGSELRAMKEVAQAYANDPALFQQHATNALQIYMQVSPFVNGKSRETWQAEISGFVSNVGEARRRDIEITVGKNAGSYLTRMVDDGTLIKRKEGTAAIYRVKETVQR